MRIFFFLNFEPGATGATILAAKPKVANTGKVQPKGPQITTSSGTRGTRCQIIDLFCSK